MPELIFTAGGKDGTLFELGRSVFFDLDFLAVSGNPSGISEDRAKVSCLGFQLPYCGIPGSPSK